MHKASLGSQDRRHVLLLAVSLALSPAAAISWGALLISLQLGRTTPSSASLAWVLQFGAVVAGVLIALAAFWQALHRLSDLKPGAAAVRASLASIPLLLSGPLLLAIYLSDEAYHYLFTSPIPRALLIWTGPALFLVVAVALLMWTTRLPSGLESWLRRPNSVPVLIFLAFASLYVFTAGGHLYSPDEKEMYEVTESIARGTLATSYREGMQRVEDGVRLWSQYGLVPSLVAVPAYWVSEALGLRPDPPSAAFPIPNVAYPLVDLLVNPLATAATCALLFCLARRLGFRAGVSLVLVLAYGMGTSAWVYSKNFFAQPLGALFLLASAYLLVRGDQAKTRDWAVAGLMMGLGTGTRFELPLVAWPLGVLMVRGIKDDPRAWLRATIAFALVFLAVSGATAGWYNWVKSGSVLVTGYAEQTRGTDFGLKPYISLFGTFFSSGFGLFTFNPITLLGVFSLLILVVSRQVEALVFGAIIVAAAVLYSVFNYWYGGYTWANRYMVLVLPFAVLPAGVLLQKPWRTPLSVSLVSGAIILGIGINLLGVLFDYNLGWIDLWSHRASLAQIEFDPHFSTIGAHVRLLRAFLSDGARLDFYLYYKLGLPALVLFLGAAVLFATLAARGALAYGASDSRVSSRESLPSHGAAQFAAAD